MKWIKDVGPGVLIAAAFIGPGTVTLCSIAGASFGFSLLWALLLSIIATIVLQEMALRIGLIARRIVSEVSENSELKQGEKIGMIRFGSRVDIYFNNYTSLVKVNQRTIAGETLIAKK